MTKLFIFGVVEGEIYCETILESAFDDYLKIKNADIDPRYHPVFVPSIPDCYSEGNEYCIIRGEVVMPKAVQLITRYKL